MIESSIVSGRSITNALTIDVEDYFQVSALAPYIARDNWDEQECRVERNVDVVLQLLSERNVQATFFTLGWIAERYPQLVRKIVAEGHELASHGFSHHRASEQDRATFLSDIKRAKALLENISGVCVRGYRAPSFSIGQKNEWAFDCILEAGYEYSSSVYPIKHDHYGFPEAPRFSYRSRGNLVEIPVTTARWLNRNWPAGGGGYFRLMPYTISRALLRRVNKVDGHPAVFYFHPWEIDAEQPRVRGISIKTRFRHYVNLARTQERLQRLLTDFRWGRLDRVVLGHTTH